jgi:hypothetical protein
MSNRLGSFCLRIHIRWVLGPSSGTHGRSLIESRLHRHGTRKGVALEAGSSPRLAQFLVIPDIPEVINPSINGINLYICSRL